MYNRENHPSVFYRTFQKETSVISTYITSISETDTIIHELMNFLLFDLQFIKSVKAVNGRIFFYIKYVKHFFTM